MATQLDLQEQEQIDQIKHFWNRWGALISALLTGVMLGLVGWNGYQFWQNRQATQAAALFDAMHNAALQADVARVQQAFDDLKSGYGSTAQTARAGLLAAKVLIDEDKWDAAKPVLQWVTEKASDEGLRALGRLRLVGVLIHENAYDQALALLAQPVPTEFAALVADAKGDVLSLQGHKEQAIEAYRQAWQSLNTNMQYRRIVEAKLNALGVRVDASESRKPTAESAA